MATCKKHPGQVLRRVTVHAMGCKGLLCDCSGVDDVCVLCAQERFAEILARPKQKRPAFLPEVRIYPEMEVSGW